MLRRMISRFGIVRICSRLQQGDAERGIIVEAGGSVQAGKGIVGQIIGSEEAIGIGAMAQEDSCSFSQISSLTCLAVVAGEADVKERLTVLWPALRLRHGWAERRFVNFQQMRGWENPFPRTGSARVRSGDYTKSQRSAARGRRVFLQRKKQTAD